MHSNSFLAPYRVYLQHPNKISLIKVYQPPWPLNQHRLRCIVFQDILHSLISNITESFQKFFCGFLSIHVIKEWLGYIKTAAKPVSCRTLCSSCHWKLFVMTEMVLFFAVMDCEELHVNGTVEKDKQKKRSELRFFKNQRLMATYDTHQEPG